MILYFSSCSYSMGFGFRKNKDERNWNFNCDYLVDKEDTQNAISGKLKLIRNWNNSKICFESKDKQLDIRLNDFEFHETHQEKKRLGLGYKNKLISFKFIDDDNKQQEHIFDMPNRKYDDFFYYLKKFIDEFKHEGKTFTFHDTSVERTINLFNPDMNDDQGEEKIWMKKKGISHGNANQLIITNYRIFYYDKKKEEVIDPIAYPINCHVENIYTYPYKEAKKQSDRGEWIAKSPKPLKHIETTDVGNLIILHNAQQYVNIRLMEPDVLEDRLKNISKLF